MTLLNLSMLYYKSKEIIVYRLIKYIRAVSKSNIKNVVNLTHQRIFKLIILRF